ncbi:MAG TPA: TRAM domain-containing protein, partial [Alphaproteobacteria bacterium]|nr:TRAM domain-containing protein [Alphaproteobacteria bacterium]
MRFRPPKNAASRRREIEVTVRALGARGDGIAEYEGSRVFVPFAAPGDRVRVRLGEARGDGVAAELLELVRPGPGRTEPPCPHFGSCGGCTLQHLADSAYDAWKRDIVRQALNHRGLEAVAVAPTVRVAPETRRRVTLAARRGRRTLFLGFHERQSNRIIDLETCRIARPDIVALLPALRTLLADLLAESEAVDVAVTLLDDGLDVVVAAARPPDLAARERLAAFAEAQDLARLSWQIGDRSADPIAYRRPGVRRFGDTTVIVPPAGFLQASCEGEAALTALVLEALKGTERVADLFAGIGTFTLPIARQARVLAVDGDAAAIGALDQGVRQGPRAAFVETRVRDLFRDPMEADELASFDAVVFDPPRAGARDQAAALAQSRVPVVVGVSCNPASF